jgi:tetratricopeptide (TPR) repeat protein
LEYGSCEQSDQVTWGTSRRSEVRLIVTKGTAERAIPLHPAGVRREANAGYILLSARGVNHMRCQQPGVRIVRNGALLLLLLVPIAAFAKKDRVPADRAEAEKWISESTHRQYRVDRLDDQYLIYSSWNGSVHYGIALARISSIHTDFDRQVGFEVVWRDYTRDGNETAPLYTKGRSESFAAALEYLANAAREHLKAQDDAAMQQFIPRAKAWREANPKPQMVESAREHQVLAEYAFKNRETEKAIKEYAAAVAIFPTWPEGQFNLATLAGEQKDYDTAILHMKQYLELVPNSPDAQNAKDSIIVWKDRLNSALEADNSQEQSNGLKNASYRRGGFGRHSK